jgi:hypothetical protein
MMSTNHGNRPAAIFDFQRSYLPPLKQQHIIHNTNRVTLSNTEADHLYRVQSANHYQGTFNMKAILNFLCLAFVLLAASGTSPAHTVLKFQKFRLKYCTPSSPQATM